MYASIGIREEQRRSHGPGGGGAASGYWSRIVAAERGGCRLVTSFGDTWRCGHKPRRVPRPRLAPWRNPPAWNAISLSRYRWLSQPSLRCCWAGGAYSVGHHIDVRFRPQRWPGGEFRALVILVTILLLLLWFSVAYLKPAVRALLCLVFPWVSPMRLSSTAPGEALQYGRGTEDGFRPGAGGALQPVALRDGGDPSLCHRYGVHSRADRAIRSHSTT